MHVRGRDSKDDGGRDKRPLLASRRPRAASPSALSTTPTRKQDAGDPAFSEPRDDITPFPRLPATPCFLTVRLLQTS